MNEKCVVVLMRTRGFSPIVARSFMRNLTDDEIQQLADSVNEIEKGQVQILPRVREINRTIDERLAADQKASVEVEEPISQAQENGAGEPDSDAPAPEEDSDES